MAKQSSQGWSPSLFLAMFIFLLIFNGATMTKKGHYRPWYITLTLLIIVKIVLIILIIENMSTSTIYGYSVITVI